MDRRFWILICLIGFTLGDTGNSPASQRPTRTIARFFGFDSGSSTQQQQQQQQQQAQPVQQQVPQGQVVGSHYRKPVVPLIYSVKYYDRTSTGENNVVTGDKVDVQEHPYISGNEKVQAAPARVFLNVYSGGQPSQVYYDNKGQLLVPCPVYDHLYVADPNSVPVVRTQVPPQPQVVPVPVPQAAVPQQQQVSPGKPKQQPQQQVQQVQQVVPQQFVYPQQGPVGSPFQEFVYYSTPTNVPGKDGVRFAVVGLPYDYPFVYSGVPSNPGYNQGYYPGPYNPYLYVKPNGPSVQGHHHHVGIVSVVPPPVPQSSVSQSVPVGQGNSGGGASPVVEKKDGDKVAEN